jgi:hypothetical protein
MSNLPTELLISTVMVSLTVVVHLAGLDLLLSLTGLHLKLFKTPWPRIDRLLVPLGIALGLFVLHGLEIWLYAFAYRLLGILPDLEQALYVSTSAYSTVGEAGAALPPPWRVLGVLEAVNGMLLLGWSTAFLFRILDHLQAERQHPLPRGAISRSPRTGGRRKVQPPASEG